MSAPTSTRTGHLPDVSPAARRYSASTWRDPRLVVGVVLVAVSALVGARLFASADDTVEVWAARDDLRAGQRLTADDLERLDVRFQSEAVADRYVSAASDLPRGTTLTRDVGAGEMLPRAALGRAGAAADTVEVPVSAPAEAVPATVRAGSAVDVWVTPRGSDGRTAGSPVKVFDDVTVVAVPDTGSALGPTGTRQVVVAVPEQRQEALSAFLARTVSGKVVVVHQR